jgi:hypothetical protein
VSIGEEYEKEEGKMGKKFDKKRREIKDKEKTEVERVK